MVKNRLPIAIITLYRKYISPLYSPRCKFYPTCSMYAVQAYKRYGFFKATALIIIRILKCNPFSGGGIDYLK